ncbi:MAG: tRNA preQ1(34) S-adenosylmethionine ribosyltransferase-isomerase QueA [Deltaproteobacteria bacterium]|nr:tRNA preQ1(34) S-adenosylmethionine ribosyltransferase-isomerase QueA [Deltaproteobacteria bacterium]
MKTKDFDYQLPEAFIAQEPSPERDHSRLMVVERARASVSCRYFYELPGYFDAGDTLVLNDSRVIPARVRGKKETGSIIELLLLKQTDLGRRRWEVLLRPAKRVAEGTVIVFDKNVQGEIVRRISPKKWLVEFHAKGNFDDFLEQQGETPLPPYIKRKAGNHRERLDRERYQTVYARSPGSVAAPTAGLHFSESILDALRKRGIGIVPVTLHVGYGTFLPVETEHVEDHRMEEEWYEVSGESADAINRASCITATGTTSARVLESACGSDGRVAAGRGSTDLFIYPGYGFKKVNRLITNFHLPMSSLFLLVCAFAGKELITKAYGIAKEEGFRFYSYGDCMLIV